MLGWFSRVSYYVEADIRYGLEPDPSSIGGLTVYRHAAVLSVSILYNCGYALQMGSTDIVRPRPYVPDYGGVNVRVSQVYEERHYLL